MWKRIEFVDKYRYVLLLCEVSSHRYCRVARVGEKDENAIHTTDVIPIELLRNYRIEEIEHNYPIATGEQFGFGPHGEWYVDSELKEMALHDRFGPVSEY